MNPYSPYGTFGKRVTRRRHGREPLQCLRLVCLQLAIAVHCSCRRNSLKLDNTFNIIRMFIASSSFSSQSRCVYFLSLPLLSDLQVTFFLTGVAGDQLSQAWEESRRMGRIGHILLAIPDD